MLRGRPRRTQSGGYARCGMLHSLCCPVSVPVPLGLLPMVLIFFIAFNRTFLSSCFSSSMSTAMGYKSVSFSFAVAIVRCAACGDQEMYCVGEKVFGQDNVAVQSWTCGDSKEGPSDSVFDLYFENRELELRSISITVSMFRQHCFKKFLP